MVQQEVERPAAVRPAATRLARRGCRAGAVLAVVVVLAGVVWLVLRPAPDPLVRGSEADARRAAQGYAEQVAAFAGNVPLTRATTSVGACPQRGDAFAGRGSAELTVPAEGHGPLLARMRDGWRAQGYQVTAAPGGRAVLSVELPPAGPVFTLASMAPRGTVVLLVRTPCLRR